MPDLATSQTSRGASLDVRDVSKSYGDVKAVRDISLFVKAGEFVSLLGPSGSGKTTLLMMIAGFEYPDAGVIEVGGQDMTYVEPNRRNIGMVFQRYALFPHMTVAGNVAFSLRMRRVPRNTIDERVRQALAMVRLSDYGHRRPDQLSGGQQQRVAVARATVFDPPMILMDEPLGALDKKLREQLQIEIKALQRELGATVIYVTHDQQEALTMSDRVAVMNNGRIEQLSSPKELYEKPQSVFVADFVGDTNLLTGTVVDIGNGIASLDIGNGNRVQGAVARESGAGIAVGDTTTLSVRPERAFLEAGSPQGLSITCVDEIYTGHDLLIVGRLDTGATFRIRTKTPDAAPASGDRLPVAWRPEDAVVFPGKAPEA
ncbi:ABC transporter ATP-binding protein [Oceanibacterium hippocampi]|uniref:Spermidine/putrescine import ATP-binding protein PotA n=1 Tax=Oceanibacterium hippocampi TaxID=745714 RepID=A0A1Y5TMY0_9PROT|nr:ABC transporter ATP-binding protein [Oceanibacterium hippocampi]SLN65727.1 Spermidine/putrescine import ATP-binding protein PotA [Oceanibacterium hippocampi]